MPRLPHHLNITNAWASIGIWTFYHRNKICYYRKKTNPIQPLTPSQLRKIELHKRAIAAWKNITHDTKITWNTYGKEVTAKRPPYRPDHGIGGYNLFLSAYHNYAILGNEHTPQPKRFNPFPEYSLINLKAHTEEQGQTLTINATLNIKGTDTPGNYRLLGKIQLTKPGYKCRPGQLRNYLATDIQTTSNREIKFIIPNYKTIWGLDLPHYQLHIRYILIDKNTGYRDYYNTLTQPIKL